MLYVPGNALLHKAPTKEEVAETLGYANLHVAPGSDALTSFIYKECWDIVGNTLTEVAKSIHAEKNPNSLNQTQKTEIN